MANVKRHFGLLPLRTRSGGVLPNSQRLPVANNYATKLWVGQPVNLSGGNLVQTAAGGSNEYVITNIHQWYDGDAVRIGGADGGKSLPANTVYGTDLQKQSLVDVVPTPDVIFSIYHDATSASYDTLAEWQALVDGVYDHEFVNGETLLNMSGGAAGGWRIVGVPDQDIQDFSAAYVRLEVMAMETGFAVSN